MRQRLPSRAATLVLAVLLAGCASAGPVDDNPACKKKWLTVISLVRCTLDIQPPPEAPLTTTPTKRASDGS